MASMESQDGNPIQVLISSIQRCFGLHRFLIPLVRPSRISLDSPTDDHFIWPKNFNFLSLITADVGLRFVCNCKLYGDMILQLTACHESHDVVLKNFEFSSRYSCQSCTF